MLVSRMVSSGSPLPFEVCQSRVVIMLPIDVLLRSKFSAS